MNLHPRALAGTSKLNAAEQLLNLDNDVDAELVMAGIRSSTNSSSDLLQNLLVIHALTAHQATKQLLTLEGFANSRR
jgi:hypothetical protein